MTKIKRGDVVLVLFPNSNLQTAKRRPAMVVQADDLQTGLPQIVLAMVTSNQARANHPSRVSITASSPDGSKAGLRLDSVIMTDNLVTVMDTEIDSTLGTLPDMSAVDNALRHTPGL